MAEADEVLVSRTMRDLTAGSGLRFTDRATHNLKGIPDEVNSTRPRETPATL
ncbi:MAG TPA: hypothetical protein VGX51_09390 [Solirubrobacteraceae bacterium]|jgi:hypothetical protein|nr:hypothetical protein [Solirubrobacteraceae bacterium]